MPIFKISLNDFIKEYSQYSNENRGEVFTYTISEMMYDYYKIGLSEEEKTSWAYTIEHLFPVLCDINKTIPDAELAFEYIMPFLADKKRVDFIICGYDANDNPSVCLVEMKDWSDSIVKSRCYNKKYVQLNVKDYPYRKHPSLQVLEYSKYLSGLDLAKQNKVKFHPCVFLPNYKNKECEGLLYPLYNEFIIEAPIFSSDEEAFKHFILSHISRGVGENSIIELFDTDTTIEETDTTIGETDSINVMSILENDKRINLSEDQILENDKQINLSDDQGRVYDRIVNSIVEKVHSLSKSEDGDGHRSVIVVKGEPGTGKTIVGLYLLSWALNEFKGMSADSIRYVSKTRPPRTFIKDLLDTSSDLNFNNRLMQMIKDPNQIIKERRNKDYDLVIVDEAHRLTRIFNTANPFEEIIKRSKVTVFLLDESQIVTHADLGYMDNIKQVRLPDFIPDIHRDLREEKLNFEFRCDREYMNYLYSILPSDNNVREINVVRKPIQKKNSFKLMEMFSKKSSKNKKKERYDFKVFRSAHSLENALAEKKDATKALVSGYVVPWFSNYKYKDETVINYDFIGGVNFSDGQMGNEPHFMKKYNSVKPDEGDYETWILRENAKDEVGCIHTVQGMSVDYVGVIIGPDLTFSPTKGLVTHAEEHPSHDNIHKMVNEEVKKQIQCFANKNEFVYEYVLNDFYSHLDDCIDYALKDASPEEARMLILNTYRVLMSRGRKGCYVYCTDPALCDYLFNNWRNYRWI